MRKAPRQKASPRARFAPLFFLLAVPLIVYGILLFGDARPTSRMNSSSTGLRARKIQVSNSRALMGGSLLISFGFLCGAAGLSLTGQPRGGQVRARPRARSGKRR